MEKKRFVCSECGAEYYLQAWKAVCPSCKSEYTLTLVEEREEGRRVFTAREWASILMAGYVLYSFATPPGATLVSYLADTLQQISFLIYLAPLLVALFLYLGTDGGVILSIILGVSAVAYGVLAVMTYGAFAIVSIILAILWIVGALLFHSYMKGVRKHQERVEDARELREYSGWAGEEG